MGISEKNETKAMHRQLSGHQNNTVVLMGKVFHLLL